MGWLEQLISKFTQEERRKKMETGRASAGREDVRVGYGSVPRFVVQRQISIDWRCRSMDDGSLDELRICNHRHGVDSFNEQPSWSTNEVILARLAVARAKAESTRHNWIHARVVVQKVGGGCEKNEKGEAKSEAKSAGCCFVRDAGYGLILFRGLLIV